MAQCGLIGPYRYRPDVQEEVKDDEDRDEDCLVNRVVPVSDDGIENVDFEAYKRSLTECI